MTVCSFDRKVKLVDLALLIEKRPYVTGVNDIIELAIGLLIEFWYLKGIHLLGEKIPKLVLKIRNHVP